MIALALAGLRARRSRTLLAAAGVLAASLVVGTGATVGYGLATGFDRAASQADLPDVIARFDDEPLDTLDKRVRALPNLAARSYRSERNNIPLAADGHFTRRGALQFVLGGRRGYEILQGRDLTGPDEVVAEQGLARAWDLHVGDRLFVGQRHPAAGGDRIFAGQRRVPARRCRTCLRARQRPRRAPERRAAVAARPVEGRRDADAGPIGLVRPRATGVRHARRRARAALAGRGDRDLAARGVLAGRAARRGDDAGGGRVRRCATTARRVRRAACARVLAGADRRAAGRRGDAGGGARGGARHRDRVARGRRSGSVPARGAERTPARVGARRPAAGRAGRRRGDRRRGRDVAGVAGGAATAGGDPARRRPGRRADPGDRRRSRGARRPVCHRRAWALGRGGPDDRRVRERGDADARARVAARAPARRPGHGRQAISAHRPHAAQPAR